jgi:hypothetical protein
MHSYDACLKIAKEWRRAGRISVEQAELVEDAVCCPERLGIDQHEVEDYYEHIRAWYGQDAREDETILQGIGAPITEQTRGSSFVTTLSG